jgi:beta-hydroxylase
MTSRFLDPQAFPFSTHLERHWQEIHRELVGVRAEMTDWLERELYGEGWKVYGLFDFPNGRPIPANIARCPVTAALVAAHIPTHGAAGFSLLEPHTRIQPHVGYQGQFLRCHLGLEIPAGDCAIRLEDETRQWQQGRMLVFDDRVMHDAWNLTDRSRAILLIDFIPQ